MSVRPSIWRSAEACSGLMYAGVPMTIPVSVMRSPLAAVMARAMPKSATRAWPPDRGGQLGPQHLDRNAAGVADVVRQVHDRHAAVAELALDGVAVCQRRLQIVALGGQEMPRKSGGG